MPDAPTTTGETPAAAATTPTTQTPTAPTTQTTPATQSVTPGQDPEGEGEAFDAERAMSLIRKLRQEAKEATAQMKELEQLRAEKKAADEAKLSEQERQANRIKQLEAEVEHERTERQERTNRYEVQLHAAKLGIVDPEAAVKLLDWGQLEYDADGRPSDVDKALKQLVKDRPYLAGAPAAQVAATNGATRASTPGSRVYTAAELADRAFYVAHRDDIVKAMREGRVTN